ncbi:MAG: D-Ala-D-Ala carboxypeptidase family metallohydrolase [Cyanobacteria bacterium P01_C01_bin.120]
MNWGAIVRGRQSEETTIMGTWIKETDEAIYLMDGGYYIDAVFKRASPTNPQEEVANIEAMKAWFKRADKPRRMTVAVGTGAPEPEPSAASTPSVPISQPPATDPEPTVPPTESSLFEPTGLQIRATTDTYFKLALKDSSQLTDREKVLVKRDTVFDIEYYTKVGSNHWEVELSQPVFGDRQTTRWYVYKPAIELLSPIRLTVTSDTLFKTAPKLSIDLPNAAKVFVKNGTQFQLMNFEPAAGNHTKIELANTALGADERTVWYAFSPDVKIRGQRQTMEVVSDTLFKTAPVQSAELSDSEKIFVKNKTVFLLNSYAQPENMHVRVALQGAFLGPENRNTWYCFTPDITISGTEIGNRPDDSNPSAGRPPSSVDRGIALQFPGFEGTYYANNPIYFETQYGDRGNFTWGEAVHANPATGFYRRPTSASVVYGILNIARILEDIRRRYDNRPIQINSWYRDPATNAAVGGASQSRHIAGDAVDFVVPGIHPYDVFADLDLWWGSRGGLASSTVFTHIDMRGYRARWDYGY